MKKIFLFDIDGTLTNARCPIEVETIESLHALSKYGLIGLVTGSNVDYINQQIVDKLDNSLKENIILLPCNGTKKFVFDKETGNYQCIFSKNIKEVLGDKNYKLVIEKIMQNQLYLMRVYNDLPLTGNFISYRESMINWCPIGRDASENQREEFRVLDKKHNIREPMINTIQKFFNGFNLKLRICLGGNTSFDIFPTGWDKTFSLNHFNLHDSEIFFVGDRCDENGNDREIYEKINNIKNGNAFKTKNPENTIKIIKGWL